jgi:hypothetical protein
MRLLLDTHAFLWAISKDPRLGKQSRQRILQEAIGVWLTLRCRCHTRVAGSVGGVTPSTATPRIDPVFDRQVGIGLEIGGIIGH